MNDTPFFGVPNGKPTNWKADKKFNTDGWHTYYFYFTRYIDPTLKKNFADGLIIGLTDGLVAGDCNPDISVEDYKILYYDNVKIWNVKGAQVNTSVNPPAPDTEVEGNLVKNGTFGKGTQSWSLYLETEAQAGSVNGELQVYIDDTETGDWNPWSIQLNQYDG
ncbi:MAG: hypothetical protein JW969_16775 [Spirochaetales bacterium]|nr:hypothetical protein [Spirochaetales bacterium]